VNERQHSADQKNTIFIVTQDNKTAWWMGPHQTEKLKNDVRNGHKIPVSQKLSKLLNKKYVKEVFLLWKPQRKMCST
jgi:hypothetical protein